MRTAVVLLGAAAGAALEGAGAPLRGPGSYYDGINTGLSGPAFAQELTDLISVHSQLSYNDLCVRALVVDALARASGLCAPVPAGGRSLLLRGGAATGCMLA